MSYEDEREALVSQLQTRENLRPETAAALRVVPRHEFVDEPRRDSAYEDRPLPIGNGQTISAPHMVAIMTDLLELQPGMRVLEIGTGCGYHAAITAEIVGPEHVYSVEYEPELADQARETLELVGYGGISVRTGDGRDGWPEHAPFDRAYLTCAASEFPSAVVDQVRAGGIVLGPLGDHRQTLVRGKKRSDGSLDQETHGGVRFVPLR
jgi:protein-L-isoaspartate(D-aspartate) O-methyltransferase